jgi:hypothetical protein
MFGKEAVCPDGLFVPAVFRESDLYLNSLKYVGMSLIQWMVKLSTWRNRRLPSPTRINLEEPGRVTQHNQD